MNEETNEETNSWEEINIEKPIDPKASLRKDHNKVNNTNLWPTSTSISNSRNQVIRRFYSNKQWMKTMVFFLKFCDTKNLEIFALKVETNSWISH